MDVLMSVLLLLAGCGVFMCGMKLMSEGLERSAGKGLRKLFGKISNNRFAGVGVGAGVTAIIQSSSATTVMVIGFVNAGVMTLYQATNIIMGANIGTTITGVMISLSAFNISAWMSALSLVGVFIMMFTKNDKLKRIGGILTGLGLIFVGLTLMSDSFKRSEAVTSAFTTVFDKIDFPLLLILFGLLFTAVLQSSSAVSGLIITMVGGSVLPVGSALFVILGTNIGTCVTAAIASVGAATNAKRAAFIHLTFNVIGTIIFTALLWPLQGYVVKLLGFIPDVRMQIAWFHVVFNVVTTAILLPFAHLLPRFAERVIKGKKRDEEVLHVYYIDDRILHTPPIAVAQVLKEVNNMAELAKANLSRAFEAIVSRDLSVKEKIYKEEEKINFINKAVSRYLIKMSSLPLSHSDEKLVGSLHHVISDIERIGDHAENFYEEAVDMFENNIDFSDVGMEEIKNMYNIVMKMYDTCMTVFRERDIARFPEVAALEAQVDTLKRLLSNNHVARLNAGICNVDSGAHFNSLITALERVADHLNNVAFSIRSPSGSQMEAMNKVGKALAQRVEKSLAATADSARPADEKTPKKKKSGAKEEKTDKPQ